MAMSSDQNRFLLACFAAFYEEVARVRLELAGEAPPPAPDEGAPEAGAPPSGDAGRPARPGREGAMDLAASIAARLRSRLQAQARDVRQEGTQAEVRLHRIAQYVMAAHADEIFILDLEWSGSEAWPHVLLERALFRSESAGRDFFTLLDQLLATRGNNPMVEDLATVFLMALRLGFKGRYRGGDGEAVLEGYRRKLLRFIGRDAALPANRAPAFSQAYLHVISESREQRLAPLSRWYLLGAAMVALHLIVSSTLWLESVERLRTFLPGVDILFGG